MAKIRSHLASPIISEEESYAECEICLQTAKSCLTAMQGLGELENDMVKVQSTKQLFVREITPLAKEIRRMKDKIIIQRQQQKQQLQNNSEQPTLQQHLSRQHRPQPPPSLFHKIQQQRNGMNNYYQPPSIKSDNSGDNIGEEMQSLLLSHQSSREMLLESQALCNESEEIGRQVMTSMHTQRQQLEMSSANVKDTISEIARARQILNQM